jgi:hypothetical protein
VLGYQVDDDQDGDVISLDSGELAIFSAGCDGAGLYSQPLLKAQPGPVPVVHGPPTNEEDPGLLILVPHTEYKLKIRWHTWLDEDNCFARWLLIPTRLTAD